MHTKDKQKTEKLLSASFILDLLIFFFFLDRCKFFSGKVTVNLVKLIVKLNLCTTCMYIHVRLRTFASMLIFMIWCSITYSLFRFLILFRMMKLT